MSNRISTIMLQRIEHREDIVTELNDMMFELINDNIISAFDDLIQLPPENIEWIDIEVYSDNTVEGEIVNIADMILKVSFVITYYKHQAPPYVLDNFGFNKDDDKEENTRIVTFGFPLSFCDASKEEITNFILERTPKIEHIDSTIQPKSIFNETDLSESQQQIFNSLVHTHKGTMQ